MNYTMLLWPHANVRYQIEARRLALAEASAMLLRAQSEAAISPDDSLPMPALRICAQRPLSEAALRALSVHSLLYGLFERDDAGALRPLLGRAPAYLGEDLPGILKYKGKTNEMFTAMLLNLALYAGDFWDADAALNVLDPMCGKGTALFVAANRGFSSAGADVDRAELSEAERFLKRYLEFHRIKHDLTRTSLTLGGGASAACAQFLYADSAENYRAGDRRSLRLIGADARGVRRALGKRAFHAVLCDLPYGVQHASRGGGLEQVLAEALPGWLEALKPGGGCAISFNAATLPLDSVRRLLEEAGFHVVTGEPFDHLAHWVEQAVTRDVAVAVRK